MSSRKVPNPSESESEPVDAQLAARAAEELFMKSLGRLSELASPRATAAGEQRLFFPNGIELVQLKFKIGTQIDISFIVAGEKAPKEPGSAESSDVTT